MTEPSFLPANSYQNLFGEPSERARPLSKKVIKTEKPEPKMKKTKPLPGKFVRSEFKDRWRRVMIFSGPPDRAGAGLQGEEGPVRPASQM